MGPWLASHRKCATFGSHQHRGCSLPLTRILSTGDVCVELTPLLVSAVLSQIVGLTPVAAHIAVAADPCAAVCRICLQGSQPGNAVNHIGCDCRGAMGLSHQVTNNCSLALALVRLSRKG